MGSLFLKLFTWAVAAGLGSFLFNLGVGFFVFVGLDFVLDTVLGVVQNHVSGIPADMFAILQIMGFTTGLSMVASAMVTGVALKVAIKKTHMGSITA